MTQRVEVFFSFWLKELKPFIFSMSQRIEPLFHMSYFFTRLKELNFFQCDAKIFSNWLQELNPLFSMTQRNDLVSPKWRTELNPFSLKMTSFFSWLKELNWTFFFKLKEWNFVLKKKRFKQLNFSHEYNSKRRLKELNLFETWLTELFFERKRTHWMEPFLFTDRSEPFFSTWLTVLNPSFQHDSKNDFFFWLTQKIEPCVKRRVSKSGTFFWFWSRSCFLSFSTWLEELFFQYVSMNWTFSWIWHRIEPFFNMTERTPNLQKNDPPNRTLPAKKTTQRTSRKKPKNNSTNWTF